MATTSVYLMIALRRSYVGLFWVCGLFMILWPVLISLGRNMPPDPGDTRFIHYVLEHGYRWITHQAGNAEFWNPNIFFPVKNTAAYSENLLGSAPLYWFWRLLSISEDSSFQLWLISVISLNFWVTYFWLRRDFGTKPLSSSLGAFLFAFGSARAQKINHSQLMPHFFTILVIHSLTRVYTEPKPEKVQRWIAAFFVACVFQIYACFYLGWFLAMGIMSSVFWSLKYPEWRAKMVGLVRTYFKPILAWGILSLLALLPMGIHYLQAGRTLGFRDIGAVTPMIPTLGSWTYLGKGSWLYGWMQTTWPWKPIAMGGLGHEHSLGSGFLTTILAVAGLYQYRQQPKVRIFFLLALTFFIAITKFYPHVSLWGILFEIVPGASGIRAISRVGLVMLIPLALGLALFLDRVKRPWLAVLLALICVAEQGREMGYYDGEVMRAQIATLTRQIDPARCRYFFYAPKLVARPEGAPFQSRLVFYDYWTGTENWKFQMDAMWAQLLTGVPTLNGYSGNFPPGWMDGLFDNVIFSPAHEARVEAGLARWMKQNALDPRGLCRIEPTVVAE